LTYPQDEGVYGPESGGGVSSDVKIACRGIFKTSEESINIKEMSKLIRQGLGREAAIIVFPGCLSPPLGDDPFLR
jgi:hypothetical protein